MKLFSNLLFLSSQSQSFTNSSGRSLTWHDSCTFVVTGRSRNRFEITRSQLCPTAASIQQAEKYSKPFLSIPMSRCGVPWPPRTKHFEPGRRGLSAGAGGFLEGLLRFFWKRRKNSHGSPHWKWERESLRAAAKWS